MSQGSKIRPCAICCGKTVWDPAMQSYFCPTCSTPTCRVYTAPSDGREAERRQRIADQLVGIAYDILARRRIAGASESTPRQVTAGGC